MEPVQLAEAIERISRRLDKLEAAAFDRHAVAIEEMKRALKRIGARIDRWDRAAQIVLDDSPTSLIQTVAASRLAIAQITHDVNRLLEALKEEKDRIDTRAGLLGVVAALVVFNTLGLVILIVVHLAAYGQ